MANRASFTTGRTPFVGRQPELAELIGRLEATHPGQGSVVLISGEPGIGKTRLLTEFAARARLAGWLVVSGRAHDTEGMPPYLPFAEALREYTGIASDDTLRALLENTTEVVALMPELGIRFRALPARGSVSPELERYNFFEGVSKFLLEVSRSTEWRGLVLCLDDLQWADQSTLLLLLHIARKLHGARVVLACTYRTEETGQPGFLNDLLADMAQERLDERISLSPLTRDQTAALVANISGLAPAPAVLQTLHEETAGNPFFVQEVVRHLLSEDRDLTNAHLAAGGWGTPEGVRAVVSRRVSRLTMEGQRLLQAGAVLGDRVAPDLVKVLIGMPDDVLVAGFEEVSAAGMLREEGMAYVFGHPLIRRVVYDSLSLARRQQLHARAAEALESRNWPEHESGFAAVGHHWRLGGNAKRAAECLLRAGDQAIALTAWEEAARHWQAALDCMEQAGAPPERRARLLEGIGDLFFLGSFAVQDCVQCYERAAALYESVGDFIGAARALSRAGRSLAGPATGFDYSGAVEHLRRAERMLSSLPASVELGEIYAALAHAESHALRSSPDEMLPKVRRLRAIAEDLDNDFLRIGADSLEGHYLGLQGRIGEGLALEALACERSRALNATSVNEWPRRWHDFLLAYSSAEDPGVAKDAGSFVYSRFYGRVLITRWTAACYGLQSLELNDPVSAKALHDSIRDPQGRLLNPFLLLDLFLSGDVTTLRRLVNAGAQELSPANDVLKYGPAILAWCEGRWTESESYLKARSERQRERGSNSLFFFTNRLLIRLYRTMGDIRSAQATVEDSLHISLACGAVKFELPCRAEEALLLLETGRLAEAQPHLDRCREILAAGEDWRGLAGRTALVEAVNLAANGKRFEAEEHFQQAVDIFRQYTLPWDQAEAYEIWSRICARFHRGRARHAFIREKLTAARAVYESIGAGQPWLHRLEAMERRLTKNNDVGATLLPDNLTQREVEVLRLIAAGNSNREIAAGLVVSVRTVERHITNIYGKIGARGKADATSYALKHSLI